MATTATAAPAPMTSATDPATVALYDAHVRQAWTKQQLSDGTRLNLGRTNQEQLFAITTTGTFAVMATRQGWQRCSDGSVDRATVTSQSAVLPNAGGHTHPLGRDGDIVADLPGKEDGRMAKLTGKPAYVISRRRVFAVEEVGPDNFAVRVVAGAAFTRAERSVIAQRIRGWNANQGGGGVQCQFIPD